MDNLETILRTVLIDALQLSHRKCLLALVRAMSLTLSINLVRLARAAFSEAKTLSTDGRKDRAASGDEAFPGCVGGKSHRKGVASPEKIYTDHGPHHMGTR